MNQCVTHFVGSKAEKVLLVAVEMVDRPFYHLRDDI